MSQLANASNEAIGYREAKLDQESDEIEEAYNSGALSEHEARRMQQDIDRQRRALYAQQEGDEHG